MHARGGCQNQIDLARLALEAVRDKGAEVLRQLLAGFVDGFADFDSLVHHHDRVAIVGDSLVDQPLRVAQRIRNGAWHAVHGGDVADSGNQAIADVDLACRPLALGDARQMQLPFGLGFSAPLAHALGQMARPRPLAHLREGGTRDLVAFRCLHRQRGGRRRRFVVVHPAPAAISGRIDLWHVPGVEAGGDLLGILLGVAGDVRCDEGRNDGCPVLAVLPWHVEEAVHDDVGLVLAECPGHALDHAVPAPAVNGVVRILGEAEIVHRVGMAASAEGERGVERTRSFLHLAGAQHAKDRATLGANAVLAALAAGDAIKHRADAIDMAECCQQPARLVIRMRAGSHEGERRGQAFETAIKGYDCRLKLLPGDQLEVGSRRGMRCGAHGQQGGR